MYHKTRVFDTSNIGNRIKALESMNLHLRNIPRGPNGRLEGAGDESADTARSENMKGVVDMATITTNVRRDITEQELREYADKVAETIVIRTYTNGNSSDDRRETTAVEKQIISSIIYGGLLAIRSGADEKSVADACEYIGNIQMRNVVTDGIGEMNGYDSVYRPIRDFDKSK